MRRRLTAAGLVALALLGLMIGVAFRIDMNAAYSRLQGRSQSAPTPFGEIQYVTGGHGNPVLVVHGGGGGWDQGELLAATVLGDGFHWIAPSRFGYPGSTLPSQATWDEQAHVYAALLDTLAVREVAVVALSQGGPSALLLALLHPERVTSLTCISCGIATQEGQQQTGASQRGDALMAIFQRDFPYWLVSRVFQGFLLELMGVNREVRTSLTPAQRKLAGEFILRMNPASPRAAGAAFDNQAPMPGGRIAEIVAPVLLVHAEDDTLQLFANAEFAAARIAGARLLRFPRGGHLVVAVELDAVRREIRSHIHKHWKPSSPP